jgi:hypothetical protein
VALNRTRAAANRTTRDLTSAQRRVLDIMSAHQFGRIENLPVEAGEPIFNQDVRIVRVARLDGQSGGTRAPRSEESALKQAVCHLFDEFTRLRYGTVVRLEFRHGLPCLLETIEAVPLR